MFTVIRVLYKVVDAGLLFLNFGRSKRNYVQRCNEFSLGGFRMIVKELKTKLYCIRLQKDSESSKGSNSSYVQVSAMLWNLKACMNHAGQVTAYFRSLEASSHLTAAVMEYMMYSANA